MRVRINEGEWSPFYSVDGVEDATWFPQEIIDLTDEEVKATKKVNKIFADSQDFLKRKLRKK